MSGRIGGGVADKATPGGRESSEGLTTPTYPRQAEEDVAIVSVSVPAQMCAANRQILSGGEQCL